MTDNLPAPILPEFPPKSEFRKWLRSLPPDEVVADAWDCWSCPLATWMQVTNIFDEPYVWPCNAPLKSEWSPDWENEKRPLPAWANAFGRGIDRFGCSGPVTAADCLAVLRKTPRG